MNMVPTKRSFEYRFCQIESGLKETLDKSKDFEMRLRDLEKLAHTGTGKLGVLIIVANVIVTLLCQILIKKL